MPQVKYKSPPKKIKKPGLPLNAAATQKVLEEDRKRRDKAVNKAPAKKKSKNTRGY